MEQTIKFDAILKEELKIRQKLKKINDNEASHFVKGNFRSNIFNLKTYLTDKAAKDQILYIPVNVVSMIGTGFADFVIGDGIDVEIDDETAQAKRNEIAEDNGFNDIIYNMAVDQSVYGYGNMRVRKDDNEAIILEQIPFEYYYPVLEDVFLGEKPTKVNIVSVQGTDPLVKKQKAKVQSYTRQSGTTWLIEYGLYVADGTGNYKLEKEYAPSETIDFLNIYTVHNKKNGGKTLGVSDFVDALDLIEEVNDRLTQISVQFVKHLNAKLSLPEGVKSFLQDKDKKVDDLEVFVHRQGEHPAQYIENNNYLMSEALDYLDKILRLICATLQAPPAFLWLEENGGAEKVEALKIRMIRFLKKVQRKKAGFENMIKVMVKDTIKFAGIDTEISVEVKFADQDLRDDQVTFENYIKMFDSKLLSKKSAIGYLMDWDTAMVDKELEEIQKETEINKDNFLANGANPDTVPTDKKTNPTDNNGNLDPNNK